MDIDELLDLECRFDFVVQGEEIGRRLDHALAERAAWASRTTISRWVAEGRFEVAGRREPRPGRKLRAGERVVGSVPKNPRDLEHPCEDLLSMPIVDRGPGFAVFDKPSGISAHPVGGEIKRTLLVMASLILPGEFEVGGPWLPHRLDRDTSGLIVVTLTPEARQRFVGAFKARRIRRLYRARTGPWPEPKGLAEDDGWLTIRAPIWSPRRPLGRVQIRPDGLDAETRVRLLERFEDRSEVAIEPITGRSHQIRAHLAHIGAPILGDPWYGDLGHRAPRLCLHATGLEIPGDVAGDGRDRHLTAADLPF